MTLGRNDRGKSWDTLHSLRSVGMTQKKINIVIPSEMNDSECSRVYLVLIFAEIYMRFTPLASLGRNDRKEKLFKRFT